MIPKDAKPLKSRTDDALPCTSQGMGTSNKRPSTMDKFPTLKQLAPIVSNFGILLCILISPENSANALNPIPVRLSRAVKCTVDMGVPANWNAPFPIMVKTGNAPAISSVP